MRNKLAKAIRRSVIGTETCYVLVDNPLDKYASVWFERKGRQKTHIELHPECKKAKVKKFKKFVAGLTK